MSKSVDYCHRNLNLCAEHFEDSAFFSIIKRNRLNQDAIPTKFDVPNPPQPIATKRKPPTRIQPPQTERNILTDESSEGANSQNTNGTCDPIYDEFIDLSRDELLLKLRSTIKERNDARKVVRRKSVVISKLKKKVKSLKETPLRSRKGKFKKDIIIEYINENFSEQTARFLTTQINLQGKEKNAVRYTDGDKELAMALYYQSPKCYKTLRKLFRLPSKSTLLEWIQVIDVKPGISEFILNILAAKVKTMSDSEKNCSLLVDEVSLKPGYQYDIKNDTIDGFVDYGHLGRKNRGANRALVFMIRGLKTGIKQTIGYYYTQNACPADTLKTLLLHVIDKVEETGFRVRVVIGDVGSSNSSMVFSKLGVTENEPFFYHENRKIYFMFDPPHLLKCTRNNLHNHDFVVNLDIISWKYFRQLYYKDSRLNVRAAPKLTDSHIGLPPFSKMKVQLAAQVFSRSVYAAMLTYVETNQLPIESIPTADFVKKINDLFDCFNSTSVFHPNKYKRALNDDTVHKKYLNEMVNFIRSWNIGNISNQMFKFNKGWIVSINSLLMLWDDLKAEGFKFILTRRLNQDPLENYFGKIRMGGGCNTDPPITVFGNIVRKLMFTSLLEPPSGKNCEDDMDMFLIGKHIKKHTK